LEDTEKEDTEKEKDRISAALLFVELPGIEAAYNTSHLRE
jgi:hypothetical protein